MTVKSTLHRGRQWALKCFAVPEIRRFLRGAVWAGGGLLLSAPGLMGFPQSFAMGLLSVCRGWRLWLAALGAGAGCRIFWGREGNLGLCWVLLGLLTGVVAPEIRILRERRGMVPALCGLWAAASGLAYALLGNPVPTAGYLVSILAAPASSALFAGLKERKDPVLIWAAQGIGVLALAQVFKNPWPGIVAAGVLALREGFPGAALGGLALDLARVSPVSMTAVVCLIWMTRLIPGLKDPWRCALPGAAYLGVMWLSGMGDPTPLGAFVLSGAAALAVPARQDLGLRRGATGMAQVRLEMMAGVLTQTREIWLSQREVPIDEDALLAKTRERACGGCPNRKNCPRLGAIPRELLHMPWTENRELPFPCRKPGRMILELRRTQEEYRRLRGDRDRNREYRRAVIQQYGFLAEYLRSQADLLPRQGEAKAIRFRAWAAGATRGREAENGDRFLHFQGPGGQYYLILCDGMGTGLGAAGESARAVKLLHRMISAGFPPEYALESLNSMLTLGDRCGAVTVDLVQIRLDSAKAAVYKWGAPESFLLRDTGVEKIGTAGPPPGIGVDETRMTVQRLSLGRGEALILLSDGVDTQQLRRCAAVAPGLPPGEMAAKLLEVSAARTEDDATVAVVRLCPV